MITIFDLSEIVVEGLIGIVLFAFMCNGYIFIREMWDTYSGRKKEIPEWVRVGREKAAAMLSWRRYEEEDD